MADTAAEPTATTDLASQLEALLVAVRSQQATLRAALGELARALEPPVQG